MLHSDEFWMGCSCTRTDAKDGHCSFQEKKNLRIKRTVKAAQLSFEARIYLTGASGLTPRPEGLA